MYPLQKTTITRILLAHLIHRLVGLSSVNGPIFSFDKLRNWHGNLYNEVIQGVVFTYLSFTTCHNFVSMVKKQGR